jgi:D-xylose transport system substrate-binding protein
MDIPNFEKAVRAGGYIPITNNANGDPAQQAADVENLLSLGIAALAINPLLGPTAVSMVRKAKDAGVPVVAYNTAIPSGDVKGFVSRDNVGVGEAIAKAALKDTGLEGNWCVVSGETGNAVADDCTKGFMNVLQPLVSSGKTTIVSAIFHKQWSPEAAHNQAQDALTKTKNNIRGFLCNNDDMAIGVAAAVKSVLPANKVWIGAQDASVEACRAILQGYMTCSSFTQFDTMGTTGGEMAVKLAKGEALAATSNYDGGKGWSVPLVTIPSFNVTRENLVDYLKKYSPQYVNAQEVFRGIPQSLWPAGADKLGVST